MKQLITSQTSKVTPAMLKMNEKEIRRKESKERIEKMRAEEIDYTGDYSDPNEYRDQKKIDNEQ